MRLALSCVILAVLGAAWAQGPLLHDLHRHLPATFDDTRAVALGDVDGDGDLDLVTAVAGGGQNRLWLNDGAGVFRDATGQLPPFAETTQAVAFGDVDGDGDLDLVIGNQAGAPTRLLLNDGTGVFFDATPLLPVDTDATADLVVDDVDGDGDLDIVLAKDFGLQNRLFVNDGLGIFSDATAQLPVDTDPASSVVLGDVDGDGDADLVFGVGTFFASIPLGFQTRLYLNDGNGTFTDASSQVPVDNDFTADVALGDVDGDGDRDIVVANWFGPDRLYLNDGVGNFSDGTAQLPVDLDDGRDVELGDLDGDGDLDMLFGNFYQQDRLYVNQGSGTFLDGTAQLPARPQHGTQGVALGDVDGDGDLDAVTGADQNDELLLNDGTGLFADTTRQVPVLADYTRSVALGDVDGDGDVDAVYGEFAELNRLMLNDGTGRFTESTGALPNHDDGTHRVTLADVDGDGDLDLLVGNHPYFETNRLAINDGTGTFTDASGQIPTGGSTTDIEVGDVDGDGDPDAVLATSGQTRLWLNDGAGSFSDATSQMPPHSDTSNDLSLFDADADGDLDVFVANSHQSAQNRLYLNDGAGTFTDAVGNLPTVNDATYSVATGDVNGDGAPDLFLANWGQNAVLLNDGAGVFTDASSLLPAIADNSRAVALADFDGDGDLDALIAQDTHKTLLVNDGAGSFTDATALMAADLTTTWEVVPGDVDRDGDIDVMFANPYGRQNRLLVNGSRQLAWRGLPRFGKPLTVDVFGPPGQLWMLFASTGTATIPAPPFGTVLMDPAGAILVGIGVLGPDGRASITAAIPPSAGVPVTLFGQALVGTVPQRLTNLESFDLAVL